MYKVYFSIFPFGDSGGNQETRIDLLELTNPLMLDGGLGTISIIMREKAGSSVSIQSSAIFIT
jgi:hypothetical protein